MFFKIYNFKLACLALLLISVLMSLGCWQLARAREKATLLQSFDQRLSVTPLTAHQLEVNQDRKSKDFRFYRANLSGHFKHQSLLLDNKIFHGKVGYEVYTLFFAEGLSTPILVDRGFVPLGPDRRHLPALDRIDDKVSITGMLNVPPRYFALGDMLDAVPHESAGSSHYIGKSHGIYRIEYLNMTELEKLLDITLFPYILTLTPDSGAHYQTEWQIVTISPEKHRAYALQWFALGLTLLILFLVLNHKAGKTA